MEARSKTVVVLGAGVSGLTTALLLSRKPEYKITLVAKHMPGDYDMYYVGLGSRASGHLNDRRYRLRHGQVPTTHRTWAWAWTTDRISPGGLMLARVSIANTPEAEWDRHTWTELAMLAKQRPEAGVHFQGKVPACTERLRTYIRVRKCDLRAKQGSRHGHWRLVEGSYEARGAVVQGLCPRRSVSPLTPRQQLITSKFKVLDESACPTGYDAGLQSTSVCINTALYLPWLASECLRAGVTIKRASLAHIDEAFSRNADGQPASVVVNCCGLGASTLGGVHDPHMVPIRGQTVLVRNEAGGSMVECSGTDDTGDDEVVYVMQRAAGMCDPMFYLALLVLQSSLLRVGSCVSRRKLSTLPSLLTCSLDRRWNHPRRKLSET